MTAEDLHNIWEATTALGTVVIALGTVALVWVTVYLWRKDHAKLKRAEDTIRILTAEGSLKAGPSTMRGDGDIASSIIESTKPINPATGDPFTYNSDK